jgi:hypothetical protein
MNNAQLATARRVTREFPTLRIRKDGLTLVPVAPGGATGTPVQVTDRMDETALRDALRASCEALLS